MLQPPNDRYVLSASFEGHDDDVRAVTFFSASEIVSSSRDATVRLWRLDAPPRDPGLLALQGKDFINSVATIPPDDQFPVGLIFSGGKDAIIEARAPATPIDQPSEALLVGHAGNVCALDVAPDRDYLVSGSWDCSAKLWRIGVWECAVTLEGHEGSVWTVLAYDSDTIITGCADKQIRIFHVTGKLLRTIEGTKDVVRALCRLPLNHPSGAHFASAGNDNIIRLWTLQGRQIAELHGHENFVYSIASLPTGELISAGEDRTVRIWQGSRCVQTITHPAISVWSVAACPETGDIVTGASDRIVRVFTRDRARQAEASRYLRNKLETSIRILHQLSNTLGVDDLALFDLRDMDPPPALGANLVMIMGTVRSFKHLNSSSDRFCRWLRKEYKLRPGADGLLGRQELKLKLRRKARKAKLASSVGATIQDLDDGIVTRWICINAGSIEDGRPASEIPRTPGFVGFGTQSPTCQLVVQLMTEDKRAELDLETLWGGLLRNRRPMPTVEREVEQHISQMDSAQRLPLSRVTYMGHQKRELHTTSALKSEPGKDASSSLLKRPPTEYSVHTLPYGKKGVWTSWKQPASEPPYQHALLQSIKALPKEEIFDALGQGPMDTSSTEVLRKFYAQTSVYLFSYKEALRFELVRFAVEIGHPNYTKQDLYRKFLNLSLSGFHVTPTHWTKILDTFLLYRVPAKINPTDPSHLRLSEDDLNLALKFISHMSLQGQDPFVSNILSRLHRAAMFQVPVYLMPKRTTPASTRTENAYPVSQEQFRAASMSQSRIRKVMRMGFTHFNANEFPVLLKLHFNQAQYDIFWDIWRRSSILGIRRTKEVYLQMFEMMAARANEKLILEMIWNVVPMMEREAIPVKMDRDLAKALMTCLVVVEPKLRTTLDERGLSVGKGPLFKLWNKCMSTILRDMGH
ncbi:ATPase synthesis protein 25 mitochondrial [Ascosphaera pollenicola]|nr:ATPase synthesis protein 25 mitochondrial [Ascosphaera pollenicola]